MADGGNLNAFQHHLISLLSDDHKRDFLIRSGGDQVKIDSLIGKIVGLYFSASWSRPCRMFNPLLVEAYAELSKEGNFQVVFISHDRNSKSFQEYFSEMPWPAVPFSDVVCRIRLSTFFEENGVPCLVILDEGGKVLSAKGVELIKDCKDKGRPFTPESISSLLKEGEEEVKWPQSLSSIFVSKSGEFLSSRDGREIRASRLAGKMVGLYFSGLGCADFTSKLKEVYEKLKEKLGEKFEIVFIYLDRDYEHSKLEINRLPWLLLPSFDHQEGMRKFVRYFELKTLPTLVILGPDGQILHPNVAQLVEDHGAEAYPFTPEKILKLAKRKWIVKLKKLLNLAKRKWVVKRKAQTLESILVTAGLDYVIEQSDIRVPVSELVGKTILLYFSARRCPPWRAILPVLLEAYHKIKSKGEELEVIFISSDRDQSSFDEFFSSMPWLALPFGDARKASLEDKFNVKFVPALIALGTNGRTVSHDAWKLIAAYGADAYPFTAKHAKCLEEKIERTVLAEWPEKVKHSGLHAEHELSRFRQLSYICDRCKMGGYGWAFCCDECNVDLHPNCVMKDSKTSEVVEEQLGDHRPEESS